MRKNAGLETAWLKDCIAPQYFGNCVATVRDLAGFDENTAAYKTLSLALKIGHALNKIAKLLKNQAIETERTRR
jgi:hypothetical protein